MGILTHGCPMQARIVMKVKRLRCKTCNGTAQLDHLAWGGVEVFCRDNYCHKVRAEDGNLAYDEKATEVAAVKLWNTVMNPRAHAFYDTIETFTFPSPTKRDGETAMTRQPDPSRYLGSAGTVYAPPEDIGYESIEVLHFLKGRQWDEMALGFVHSLRPSYIRVTEDCIKCDARLWRVTVYVSNDGVIRKITQEVELGLPDGVSDGDNMMRALRGERMLDDDETCVVALGALPGLGFADWEWSHED